MLLGLVANTAQARRVSDSELRFAYISNDGSVWLDCTHWRKNQKLPDWEVICGKNNRVTKTFQVHFVTKQIQRQQMPQTSYEFLYWVTEPQGNKSVEHTPTIWMHTRKFSELDNATLSTGVDNGSAILNLEFKPEI